MHPTLHRKIRDGLLVDNNNLTSEEKMDTDQQILNQIFKYSAGERSLL